MKVKILPEQIRLLWEHHSQVAVDRGTIKDETELDEEGGEQCK